MQEGTRISIRTPLLSVKFLTMPPFVIPLTFTSSIGWGHYRNTVLLSGCFKGNLILPLILLQLCCG
jgi:hypothetical protein